MSSAEQSSHPDMSPTEIATAYHAATKHHFHRFARSLGYMDWATQPDPFRRYADAPLFHFPLAQDDPTPRYDTLYEGAQRPQPVTIDSLGRFFECSLAISAWKAYGGARWALRCNPSSGNLHPTEGYLITPAVEDLSPGVYHYAPKEHGLEQRTPISHQTWELLAGDFPQTTFFVGLSSILWREAWKYGERAFRYCQHDVGHALGAMTFAAAANGWYVVHLSGLGDRHVARLLGLDRDGDYGEAEREHPDLIAAVVANLPDTRIPRVFTDRAIEAVAHGGWTGRANVLSQEHIAWEAIDVVAEATAKPPTRDVPMIAHARTGPSAVQQHGTKLTLQQIAKQRRSAVAMDGRTAVSRAAFYTMLARTLPRSGALPWDTLGPPHYLHFALFVHRVDELPPGWYMLVRDPLRVEVLRAALNKHHRWQTPEGCPGDLPLFMLQEGDWQGVAAQVSCTQEIAGAGAFSLGMIAEFARALNELGPWGYRRLFWEAGVIGQVLYLEAEAAGVRSTGIGCYFDDPVHQVFGFDGREWQSMYHFTVGGAVEDWRLQTDPPYPSARAEIYHWATPQATAT